ncbi:helix-turn-helix domain-containing protein [Solirubrobacter sp. CPCC 204708]|uniref:Helix-turn-helix domain-containing protein n=1 Tax=Solirubrobacter deserti TaxID=2282478 RepID=A0ABT4RLJ6_9ACTN|nr:helix-turn-helix domain-containing protein [Solirubrobacter deserti]MBE2319086.1 helix-turn-helix domain-containing protein [Solirubrobacter deserti]MDA0139165.1 helix-turn-helix domain-containing protein [Solirubrobacter deserti]
MSDVIAGLRRDLEQRLNDIERQLAEHEPLLREREQIQAALEQPPFASSPRPVAAKRAPARKAAAKRAPRGANREAILKAVDERPGASATEIADVTNISRAVTYNTLAKLVEQGRLEKAELPGGQTGYKPATPAEPQPGL